MSELKNFRQLHSKTPGHPENILTPGVEITTGPLGQGFANGVGMGIAQKHLEAIFNKKGFPVIDHFIYCICSDGDLMEGVSYESASLAGHLKLDNLIYLYDDNSITIDGSTDLAFTEDVTKRFEAAGWEVSVVEDGNDIKAIEKAIKAAQKIKGKPKLIRIKTIIGFGMPKAGNVKSALGRARRRSRQGNKTKSRLGRKQTFLSFRKKFRRISAKPIKNGAKLEKDWDALVKKYEKQFPELGKTFADTRKGELADGWEKSLPKFDDVESKATRAYSGEVINAIAGILPQMIGGSAISRRRTTLTSNLRPIFKPENTQNRNIHFGIREHAMGSAMNGMALYGSVIPFGGTFQTFSRLYAPGDSSRRAVAYSNDLRFHARFDRFGRRRSDASIGRTSRRLARDSESRRHSPVRRARNPRSVACRASTEETRRPRSPFRAKKSRVIDRKKFADAKGLHKGAYVLAEAEDKNGKSVRTEINFDRHRFGSRSGNGSA